MKSIFDYIKSFAFKNLFAIFLTWQLLDILRRSPELRDLIIVLLTLVVKHFFDSNTGSVAKDITISKALDNAHQLPAVNTPVATTETGDINVKK